MATYVWIAVMSFTAPFAFLLVRDRHPLKRWAMNTQFSIFMVFWTAIFIALRLATH